MTWEHYVRNWRTLKSDLKEASGLEVLALLAQTMIQSIKTRVFEHGTTTDGQLMEAYSTKPASYLRSDFDNKSAFTAGRGKSMFLPQGYRQLRQIQGKQVSFINLDYTGKMKDALKTQTSGNTVKVLFSTKRAKGLAAQHELRFGPIFSASEQEREALTQAIEPVVARKTIDTLTA